MLKKIDTILFDLDGTLLPMDKEVFLYRYLELLGRHFAPYTDPRELVEYVLESIEVMTANDDPATTNQDVFWGDFFRRCQLPEDQVLATFESFYQHQFPLLADICPPTPLAPKVVSLLAGRSYTLILATNPVFPRVAIEHRMAWAGVAEAPWELITTYEESRFCKPNPSYYKEILHLAGKSPEQCLMVGNDTAEDLVAGTLGIKTFLLTDHLIDQHGYPQKPDWEGSMSQFLDFARQKLTGPGDNSC